MTISWFRVSSRRSPRTIVFFDKRDMSGLWLDEVRRNRDWISGFVINGAWNFMFNKRTRQVFACERIEDATPVNLCASDVEYAIIKVKDNHGHYTYNDVIDWARRQLK